MAQRSPKRFAPVLSPFLPHVIALLPVTLWTDRAYPVIAFNIHLTGYDVQSLAPFLVGNATGKIRREATRNRAIASMRSKAGHALDVQAATLGNGCSAEAQLSEITAGKENIGPRP